MNKYSLIFALVFTSGIAAAQTAQTDTVYAAELKEVNIRARWKSDAERYRYNQMKHYVKIILPYLNASTKLFNELNTQANDPNLSHRERKRLIAAKEDEMREQFEDRIKDLNVTQGVLLVKLIARQTNMNIYQGLKEFKNSLTAAKWQVWARVNGMNLDRKYVPVEEPDLENIMYELGYPLPQSYASVK
jgi:hypothetical protein